MNFRERNCFTVTCRATALAAILFLTVAPLAFAAPITFLFEAEVTEVRDLVPNSTLSLPFSVSIGNVISGSIEFEPVAFGQAAVLNSLNLELFGYEIAGTDGSIRSLNNQALTPWFDSIRSNNDFLMKVTTIPEVSLENLSLGFSTTSDLLSPADHLGDVEVWNRIPPLPTTVGIPSERRVGIQLTTLAGESPLVISAKVGPMRVIPEPSTIVLTGIFAAFGVLRRRY